MALPLEPADKATLLAMTVAERRDLSRLLTTLTARQWETASLRKDWAVKHVVAHLTLPYQRSTRSLVWQTARHKGSFGAAADSMARMDAERFSGPELAALYRENVESSWTPPGGGQGMALAHEVVHGLDITIPLGTGRTPPADHLRAVLDALMGKNRFYNFDPTGKRVTATDLDYGLGTGPEEFRAPAVDLILWMAGRRDLPAPAASRGAGV